MSNKVKESKYLNFVDIINTVNMISFVTINFLSLKYNIFFGIVIINILKFQSYSRSLCSKKGVYTQIQFGKI